MEVSVLKRCPYLYLFSVCVHIVNVSILRRCLYYGGVHIMEVYILWRCPYYRGVHVF